MKSMARTVYLYICMYVCVYGNFLNSAKVKNSAVLFHIENLKEKCCLKVHLGAFI